MKLFFRLSTILLLSLFGFNSNAQSTFTLSVEFINDTAFYYADSIQATFILTYDGQGPYQGTVQIGYSTENSGVPISDTLSNFSQNVQLSPGQQATLNTQIPVRSSFFSEGGGHTVIVWPVMTILPPGSIIDSASFEINVLGWLKQTEWALVKQTKIFPIPANDYIILEKPEGKAHINILDIQGKILQSMYSNEKQVRIPLTDLPKGNYFLRYADGIKQAEIQKFIKR